MKPVRPATDSDMRAPVRWGRAAVSPPAEVRVSTLTGPGRERAIPLVRESFHGYYRWHAKRTLREVPLVRGAEKNGELLGVAMLDRLAPEAGYVFYLAVGAAHRRHGIGGVLLDDALAHFLSTGAEVVFAAAEADNAPSIALFRSRGFRLVERDEAGFREGGLGAWGLRSRMRLVRGEVLLGRRFDPTAPA